MDNYDFQGWATRANLKCSDGRVICPDAFKDDDGRTVPLVWNHQHDDVYSVLGHALLKNEKDGVRAYCTFNDSDSGKVGKALVEHGDVTSLSICANKLIQQGANVTHGTIREVSLVLAGANPGAKIDNIIAHGDDDGESAYIFTGEGVELCHADKEPEKKNTNDSNEDLKGEKGTQQPGPKPQDKSDGKDNKKVLDIINSMSEEQRTVLYAMIGSLMGEEEDGSDGDNKDDEPKGDDDDMKHNIFDQATQNTDDVLLHSDGTPVTLTFEEVGTIFADAKRYGSLKDSCLAHGIDNIDYLFPDDRNMTTTPIFIKRDTEWVKKVMGGVHHTPFSRIRSVFADITEDDARAKGYIKGKIKKEEFFSLIKRSVSPTTVHKKQKMDRDDVVDITDFDVVAWLKTEMRGMLDEELARAILIGDGRLNSSDDKINEGNIIPIAKDEDLFTVKVDVEVASAATDDDKALAFIDAVIRNRKLDKGSGNPSLYTTEDILTSCLLLKDSIGHDLYPDIANLAKKLRVKEIVPVPVMEGVNGIGGNPLMGVFVNLADYNVGADKGGAVNMFDDFDIDYNQQKYLIETRCSGALTVPYSAMVFEQKTA